MAKKDKKDKKGKASAKSLKEKDKKKSKEQLPEVPQPPPPPSPPSPVAAAPMSPSGGKGDRGSGDASAVKRGQKGAPHRRNKDQDFDEGVRPSYSMDQLKSRTGGSGGIHDGSKYIKNPSSLPLEGLMKEFIGQLRTWRQLNQNNMNNEEDAFSQAMMHVSNEQLTKLQFHDVKEHPVQKTPKVTQQYQEGSDRFPAIKLQSGEFQKVRLRRSVSTNSVVRDPDNLWVITDAQRQKVSQFPLLNPLLKPAHRMVPSINERIRRGLTETFCYFARADVNYDLNKPPHWISRKQWAMFVRAFAVAEITGISETDLVNQFAPPKMPILFSDFVKSVSLVAKCTLELFYDRDFDYVNSRCKDEPDAYALYRFTELFGFHEEGSLFRKYLRGRQRVGR